jgi:hypothetical protein
LDGAREVVILTIEEQMSPARLSEVILARMADAPRTVSGFWFQVLGDRDSYAESLRTELIDQPVAVLVVRTSGFNSPNSVLNDFVDLIADNRKLCEQALTINGRFKKFGIVCLSRRTLGIPQVPSPATFPPWFPKVGNRRISVLIEDVTWTGRAPLSSEESGIPALSAALFDLEGSLLRRLGEVHACDPGAADAFWEHLRGSEAYRFDGFISDSAAFREGIFKSEYRPSTREGRSLTARLWRKVQSTQPDAVGKVGAALSIALQLPEPLGVEWYRTLLSMLARTGNRARSDRDDFAMSLVATTTASLQFITAAKHSERYMVPVPLSRSLSYDLRSGLASARSVLATLEAACVPTTAQSSSPSTT